MAISEADKEAIAQRWQEILNQKHATFFAPPQPPVDVRKEFCEVWPTAEKVLKVLQSILPPPGSWIVGVVIAAGEAVSQQLCSRHG